jgi:hypothetical protein
MRLTALLVIRCSELLAPWTVGGIHIQNLDVSVGMIDPVLPSVAIAAHVQAPV